MFFAKHWLQKHCPNLFYSYIKLARTKAGWLFLFLVLSILLNYIFFLVSEEASYERPLLAAEWIACSLLIFLRLNTLSFLLFIFALANEVALALSVTLQLLSLEQVIAVSSFVLYINEKYLFFIFIILIIVSLIFPALIFIKRKIPTRMLPYFFLCTGLSYFLIFPDLYYIIKHNSFFAAIHSLSIINYKKLFLDKHEANLEYSKLEHPSAFELTIKDKVYSTDQRPDKILYIVAESWGYPKDKNILDQQINTLTENNPSIAIIQTDKIYADNSTIAAELRELCNKKSNYLSHIQMTDIKRLKIISDSDSESPCLPEYLNNLDYFVLATHAANGKMYDRIGLYKIFGFTTTYFDGNMPINTKKRCKSWPGYCDTELMQIMQDNLLKHEKILFYWMTLNSHVPYEKSDINDFNKTLCDRDLPDGYSEQLCNYHHLHLQFFKNLSLALKNPKLSGLQVVIVGDHKPKFMDGTHKISSSDLFLDNTVPYIYFMIR